MQERGGEVDHCSFNRWVLKFTPLLEQAFQKLKLAVGISWCLYETYIRVKGQWKYLYRAVDKAGRTVDFLLTARRDRKAASRFLRNAIDQCSVPQMITIDKSGANNVAVESYNTEHNAGIELLVAGLGSQVKYLNNIGRVIHLIVR